MESTKLNSVGIFMPFDDLSSAVVRHVSPRNCACAVTLPRVTGKKGSGSGRQDNREPDVFIDF